MRHAARAVSAGGARNLRLLGFCCGSEPGARGTSPGSPTMSTPRTKEALRTGLKLTMKLTVGVVAALTTAGFCQHLYSCIYDGAWRSILGWVVFPIGVVHGWESVRVVVALQPQRGGARSLCVRVFPIVDFYAIDGFQSSAMARRNDPQSRRLANSAARPAEWGPFVPMRSDKAGGR